MNCFLPGLNIDDRLHVKSWRAASGDDFLRWLQFELLKLQKGGIVSISYCERMTWTGRDSPLTSFISLFRLLVVVVLLHWIGPSGCRSSTKNKNNTNNNGNTYNPINYIKLHPLTTTATNKHNRQQHLQPTTKQPLTTTNEQQANTHTHTLCNGLQRMYLHNM